MNTEKNPLVVLDTNVIVSGLLDSNNHSYPSKIISAWLFGNLQVAISHQLKQEVNYVFSKSYIRKALKDKSSIKPILGRLFNKSITIFPMSIKETVFSDHKDHFLFEIAVTANAKTIVTGDKKLLSVKKIKKVHILNPQQFCIKFKIK